MGRAATRFGMPTQAVRVQSMVSHKLFFFFFFHSSDCVCRHNPVAPTATVAATQQRHDEHHGSNMGSRTPLHDTQLPDSDTMSSTAAAVAAVQAAAHHCMTCNCPTAAGRGWAACNAPTGVKGQTLA